MFCRIDPPLVELAGEDPVNGWNHYSGFGEFTEDQVAVTAAWAGGPYPWLITDATSENVEAGCSTPPATPHSFWYGSPAEGFECPPVPWEDEVGYCNILMDATFSCEMTSTEPTSWGAVKNLFR